MELLAFQLACSPTYRLDFEHSILALHFALMALLGPLEHRHLPTSCPLLTLSIFHYHFRSMFTKHLGGHSSGFEYDYYGSEFYNSHSNGSCLANHRLSCILLRHVTNSDRRADIWSSAAFSELTLDWSLLFPSASTLTTHFRSVGGQRYRNRHCWLDSNWHSCCTLIHSSFTII